MNGSRLFDAVIFDWAGTIVDPGSRAPLAAFRATFEAEEIDLTDEEIRGPMGLGKREHIESLLRMPGVAEAFLFRIGRRWDACDVDRMYQRFESIQPEIAAARAAPIAGVVDLLARLREAGIKVGGTTGFSRAVMTKVVPAAAQNGVTLDASVCVDEVKRGRPAPDMLLECASRLGVEPSRCLVFDDTPVGIEAAVAAGMPAWGVSLSGNSCGLEAGELESLDDAAKAAIHARATASFERAGARGTLESVAAFRLSSLAAL